MSESPFTKTEPQLNIGLLGYGTVGRTVAELLDERDCGIRIRHILRRPGHADGPLMTDSFEAVLNDPEVTCIVEALPGRDPALSYIRAALAAGKHVVTSNKAAVAADLKGLAELARANNVSLLFEASCGGGMHWVEMIKKTARFNEVSDVSGILNGTCNYMLDHMERSGLSFEEALARAQALGYAEADPTADITGADVRNKAIISASLAYRTPVVSDIPTAGIVGVTRGIIAAARERGRSLRLMMLSERRGDRYAVGIVESINLRERSMVVRMDDRRLLYPAENLNELEIAYAITVHKSQGSEFPAVILPVAQVPPRLCYRNLFYTGVTRARRLCVVAGRRDVVNSMMSNIRQNLRYSGLCALLQAGQPSEQLSTEGESP